MNKKNLVICPVYNEGHTLNEFYSNLRKYYGYNLLFINDGSDDKGNIFLEKIKNNNTFLIHHSQRQGYGAALLSGFQFAIQNNYEKVITIDADHQHNPQHIPTFFKKLSLVDIVLGSRYTNIEEWLYVPRERLLINRYIKQLIYLIFDIGISDPFCGYRGYNISFLKKSYLKEKSYGFGLEILLEVIKQNATYKEIPVEVLYLDRSRRFLDGLNNPKERLLHYLKILSIKKKEIQSKTSCTNALVV